MNRRRFSLTCLDGVTRDISQFLTSEDHREQQMSEDQKGVWDSADLLNTPRIDEVSSAWIRDHSRQTLTQPSVVGYGTGVSCGATDRELSVTFKSSPKSRALSFASYSCLISRDISSPKDKRFGVQCLFVFDSLFKCLDFNMARTTRPRSLPYHHEC